MTTIGHYINKILNEITFKRESIKLVDQFK